MAYSDGYAGGYAGGGLTLFTAPLFSNKWGDEFGGHAKKHSVWRYYEPMVEFVQTVIIASGVVIPTAAQGARTLTTNELDSADAGTGQSGKAVFRGRKQHTVSVAEGSLLSNAGYTVT